MNLNLPEIKVGNVSVSTTNNRVLRQKKWRRDAQISYLTLQTVHRLPLGIRPIAYKKSMEAVIALYMKEAIKTDRTTVYNAIKDAGQPKLAEYIRKM